MFNMVDLVQRKLRRHAYPTTIIIHVGCNNVFASNTYNLRREVFALLESLRQLLPLTRLIWSDVLPRLFYYGKMRPVAVVELFDLLIARPTSLCESMTTCVTYPITKCSLLRTFPCSDSMAFTSAKPA